MMTLQRFATHIHSLGANVLPIGTEQRPVAGPNDQNGKGPAIPWSNWQKTRQTAGDLQRMPWNGYTRQRDGVQVAVTALGIVNGVSGWHDLEFDGVSGSGPMLAALDRLGLNPAYPWAVRTGSGHGVRIIFRCDGELPPGTLPAKTGADGKVVTGVFSAPSRCGDFDHAELRWERCQSIVAGRHPSGGNYQFISGQIPTEPPAVISIERIMAALHELCSIPDQAPRQTALTATVRAHSHTRPAAAADETTTQKFVSLMADLVPDFDPGQIEQHVLCPFHPDNETPSLHITLNLPGGPGFYCFSPGCPAHGGGHYGTLRMLARRQFGLIETADADTEAEPGAYTGHLPWALTPDDWRQCPECSALWHGLGRDRRPEYHHRLCHRRDCPVSQKIRAANDLGAVPSWPRLFVGTVANSAWRRLRDQVRRAGAQCVGIPLADDLVLTVAGVAADGLAEDATDRHELLVRLMAALAGTPKGTRVRKAQKEKILAAADDATGKDQVQAFMPLPFGLKLSAFRLQVPPDHEDDLRAIWQACGCDLVRGARGFTTAAPLEDAQLAELAAQLAQFRIRLARECASSISAYLQGDQHTALIDDDPAERSSQAARRWRRRPRAAGAELGETEP